jgi:hypothetical protein
MRRIRPSLSDSARRPRALLWAHYFGARAEQADNRDDPSWVSADWLQPCVFGRFQPRSAERVPCRASIRACRRCHACHARLPQWADSAILIAAYGGYHNKGRPAQQRGGCAVYPIAGGAHGLLATRAAGSRVCHYCGRSGSPNHHLCRERLERQSNRGRSRVGSALATAVTGWFQSRTG